MRKRRRISKGFLKPDHYVGKHRCPSAPVNQPLTLAPLLSAAQNRRGGGGRRGRPALRPPTHKGNSGRAAPGGLLFVFFRLRHIFRRRVHFNAGAGIREKQAERKNKDDDGGRHFDFPLSHRMAGPIINSRGHFFLDIRKPLSTEMQRRRCF